MCVVPSFGDMHGNVKKSPKAFQTFAQYSLLSVNLGLSDATEEIWKTPPGLGSHELKMEEFGGKGISFSS